MRKTASILLLVGSLVLGSAAAEGVVKGRVVTLDGKPVSGAIVSVAGESVRAETDADGAFSLEVPGAARYRLIVKHPSFYEETILFGPGDRSAAVIVRLTPLIRQSEEIAVTALRYPESISKIPAAQTVVSSEALAERMAPNITEALSDIPGLAPLGSGGFSLVPSIRGLARNRILLLVDGCRIVSDRRTGPNASFVSPEDLGRIEILRSPSSIFYGSDAIGGVVQLFTADPPVEAGFSGRVHAGYGSNNGEKSYGLSLAGRRGPWGFHLSCQGLDAGNYRSPLGSVLQSQYAQNGLFGKVVYETEARRVSLSLLGSRGTDIGKPNRTSAAKPTWYPRENENLIHLAWREKAFAGGELAFNAYANPNFLETRTRTIAAAGYVDKDSFSRTETTDFGAQLSFARRLSESFRLTAGLDYFGRGGVQAILHEESFDGSGALTKTYDEKAYDRGRRSDVGLYLSADYSGILGFDLVGGVRWDSIVQAAHPGGGETSLESRRSPWTGFLALSYHLSRRLVAFVDLSTAYRTPGLSELFYTGITGRGMIIAQPDLTPERSSNWDAGLKWIGGRIYAGAYVFQYTIAGLIDRYLVAPQIYTYGNLDKARIRGLELEAEFHPSADWMVFGSLALLEGRSVAIGASVNDVPPARLTLGGRVFLGRFSVEATALLQRRKSDPGPAEIAIPSYSVLSLKANYYLHPFGLFLVAGNLTDRVYLGRADPEAMEEPGRGVKIGASFSF
ncbi:MAG: TonB-dependent receptor [Candidatus Aminicenantes bacterium]|nr:TonB-dependent receptor [Candidatus Aminicenantes bacterium]